MFVIYVLFDFISGNFCDWFYDEKTCWPFAKAHTNVSQPCPTEQGFDKMSTTHFFIATISFIK